jgi:hypothetical protein
MKIFGFKYGTLTELGLSRAEGSRMSQSVTFVTLRRAFRRAN